MPGNPIEFMRRLVDDTLQRAGNRVQVEDANGDPIAAGNPLPVNVAVGIANPLPVSIANGIDVAQGATTDAEVAAGNGSIIALLKRLRTLLNGGLPAALGQGTMAQSMRVVIASDQSGVAVTDTWTPNLQSDEGANDSDKNFTVPAATQWQVLWIWVELTSTATAGNRQITIELQDNAADVIGRWKAGAVQAASLTRNYCFAPSNADLTAFRDTTFLMTPIPPTIILPAGYIVRVYDSAAVDAAADDMVVQMMIASRGV